VPTKKEREDLAAAVGTASARARVSAQLRDWMLLATSYHVHVNAQPADLFRQASDLLVGLPRWVLQEAGVSHANRLLQCVPVRRYVYPIAEVLGLALEARGVVVRADLAALGLGLVDAATRVELALAGAAAQGLVLLVLLLDFWGNVLDLASLGQRAVDLAHVAAVVNWCFAVLESSGFCVCVCFFAGFCWRRAASGVPW